MDELRKVVERAGELGLELVPKLNLSQSRWHHHNDWFRPHHEKFDSEEYWDLYFEIVDELIGEMKPARFFHIGMDEDHDRSLRQYAAAIETAHGRLSERGLRAVIWNDSAYKTHPTVEVHAERCMHAEKTIPKDVVEVVWCYHETPEEDVKRLAGAGFEVWGAPGAKPELVGDFREKGLELGMKGMLLTRWISCNSETREELLGTVRKCGPLTGAG
jgi:hypothetical protein